MTDEIPSLVGVITHFENCRWEHLLKKIYSSISCLSVSYLSRRCKEKNEKNVVYMTATSSLGTLGWQRPMWNIHFCNKWPKLHPACFWCWKIVQNWYTSMVLLSWHSISLPLQGSFFTKNSSSAIHPPPTRTMTVLRRIRTSRSCWESPNCEDEGRENL